MDHGSPNLVKGIIAVAMANSELCFPQLSYRHSVLYSERCDISLWHCRWEGELLVFGIGIRDICVSSVVIRTDIFVQDNYFRIVNAVDKIFSKVLISFLGERYNSSCKDSALLCHFKFLGSCRGPRQFANMRPECKSLMLFQPLGR